MKNSHIRYLFLTIILLVIISTLAGCSSTGNTAGSTATETTGSKVTSETSPASNNEILIESNTFKPDSLSVKVGDTVTWINNDSYNHTVNAKNGEFDSGNMANGEKFSFTFTKEGTIDYICGIHAFMTGKIIVTK